MTATMRTTMIMSTLRRVNQSVNHHRFQQQSLLPQHRLMSSVITLSDGKAVETFRDTNNKNILYFTANWCPPCKAIKPVYESLSKDYPEVAFGKIDIDENPDAANDYEIRTIPTFVFNQGEKVISKFSGANSEELTQQIISLKDL